MVCVLTLTFQLCIQCIHMGTLSCPKESQPRWWVCGRSLEGSQRLSPRTSPLLTPQLSSGAHPGFTSITLESQCPHLIPHWFPGTEVRHGDPGALGRLTCRVCSPLAQTQPWKWEICHQNLGLILSYKDPWPLQKPEPWGSRELGAGWASRALLWSPPCSPHLTEEGNLREDGRHVWSSECPAAPAPILYRWGDRGALADKQEVVPGGLPPPLGFPTAMAPQQRGDPSVDMAPMSPGRAQEASQPGPEVSALSFPAQSDRLL